MTIKAVHLIDEGVYLVDLPWGDKYEVDGLAVEPRQVVVPSLDSIVRVITTPGALLTYGDADGETLNVADYATQREALLQGATRDDDGDVIFPSLDAEFAYRKFVGRWSPKDYAPTQVRREPVQAEVAEVRINSGDPDIVSLWNSPRVEADRALYSLNRDTVMVRAAHDFCALSELTLENGHHPSYLRFAKVDGEYAFSDDFDQSRRPFIGTLEQCKAEKAACIARVEAQLLPRALRKKGQQLANVGDVLLSLRHMQQHLGSTRAKSGTEGNLSAARKHLSELIANVERAARA